MTYFKLGAVSLVAALAAGAFLVGCGGDDASRPGQSNPAAAAVQIPEDMKGVAELPEAEQKVALEQEICPVSDKKLGSMGKPIKVTVNGKQVYLCCAGCEDMIKENPDKYLGKLKEKN